MKVAESVALRSKDPITQVGAVVVSPDQRTMHTGYNGFPTGLMENDSRWVRPTKYQFTIHGEVNAILNSKADLSGWTLYLTLHPCSTCALIIIQSGIKKVIYKNSPNPQSQLDYEFAASLFKEAGIELIHYQNPS
jgi:dCMP deaminase